MIIELKKELLEQYFKYDPSSPSGLRWSVNRHNGRFYYIVAGDAAGSIQKDRRGSDYKSWVVSLNNKLYLAHRIIYCLCHGSLSSELYIDHIDGNPLNNKIENLRAVSPKINSRNSKKYAANTSGVNGVHIQTDKKTGHAYIIAFWNENGKRTVKCFSVNKYGYDLAFELACEHRKKAIDRLNKQGAGYSERHGQDE